MVFLKRKNLKSIDNRKLNPYERCCTFDGPSYFSEESIFVLKSSGSWKSNRESEKIM